MHNTCTSNDFKNDINQLCDKCPLVEIINTHINEQIIFQAKDKKETLTKKQYLKYTKKEIKNASRVMESVFLTERQNVNYKKDPYRKNRIEVYIFNKERIKALNRLLNNPNNDFNHRIFKKEHTLIAFNKYCDRHIIDPYPDYSYLFQRLKHEKLIYHIKHFDFMTWLNDEGYISSKYFDIFINNESFRSLSKSYSKDRYNNFNFIFNL
jgi:hypothetical protein